MKILFLTASLFCPAVFADEPDPIAPTIPVITNADSATEARYNTDATEARYNTDNYQCLKEAVSQRSSVGGYGTIYSGTTEQTTDLRLYDACMLAKGYKPAADRVEQNPAAPFIVAAILSTVAVLTFACGMLAFSQISQTE